ncbi:hypothetical protein OG921_03055 [Aldersonia sp. NBC_00410]|uniref:hypothetical protein n=1 Tax=Aldersonia sp. NBC_00410 TaxID=2975954 RepID=UPI002254EBB5|nr:hypothetical protein [Aldersonia sp. NBC_00410]MCX5042170.1 hypothetical protein [Aldersonia sp. NBC_00410]
MTRAATLLVSMGFVVAAAVGCSSSDSSSSDSEATLTSVASGADELAVDITIANGSVTPTNAQLKAVVGQPIVLRVTSDAEDELHVHSVPDHEFTVEPRAGQSFEFDVTVPGRVEVELHELGRTVATIDVTK